MNEVESSSLERQQLMVRLLDAVKQCQIRFGGKTELATESDSRVCVLCSAWESVLQHGLKHNNRAMSTLKQLTEVTGLSRFGTGIMDDIKNLETEPAFWGFTKEHMSLHELKRYTILRHISTDAGRGRAWLRSALNEHSLERYMHTMSNSVWISQYYEDWAFLRDAEKIAVLPDMAAGLGSILFAINIDNTDLNTIKPATGLDTLLSRAPVTKPTMGDDDPPPVVLNIGSPQAEKKCLRRRKKKPAKIVTFEYDDVGSSSYSASPASTLVSPTGTDNPGSPPCPGDPVTSSVNVKHTASTTATNDLKSEFYISCSVANTSTSPESCNSVESVDSFRHNPSTESSSTSIVESSPVLRRNTRNTPTRLTGDAERFSFHATGANCGSTARSPAVEIPHGVTVGDGTTAVPRSSAAFNESRVPGGRVEALNKSLTRTDSASSNMSLELNGDAQSVFRTSSDACLTPLNSEGRPIELDTTAGSLDGDTPSGSYGSYDSREMPAFSDITQRSTLAVTEVQQALNEHAESGSSSLHRGHLDGSCNGAMPSLTDALSNDELKDAVVAMMLRREEVEEQNRRLHAAFEVELATTAGLRDEIAELRTLNALQQNDDAERIKNLTRENDLLKHQLRKYVGAVQMLRQEGARPEDFPGIHLDALQPAIPASRDIIDYSAQASEYECKLIQVAEMHGELMEFNDLLQKQLIGREAQLRHLTEELVSLRGPLPRSMSSSDDVITIASADRNHDSLSSRPLINIWIPSAFLRGSLHDGFHVYQVYVRIRDEEWNIYRRYAEFYELRARLRKDYPIITTFDFPPKKAFGKKDAKIVEVRRKTLEAFLRRVVMLLTQELSIVVNNPCRQTLTDTLPFFGDTPVVDKNKRKTKKSRGRASTESAGGPQASAGGVTGSHHYMGL